MIFPQLSLRMVVTLLLLANLAAGGAIFFSKISRETALYFLSVGQGDAQLVVSQGARFLIDGGKGDAVVRNLDAVLPSRKRIDVLIVSHPEQDHIGGLFHVTDRFDVRLVVWNGEGNDLWRRFQEKLTEKNISFLDLRKGDRIRVGEERFDILWPGDLSRSVNNNAMVIRLSGSISALFTGDISRAVEEAIMKESRISVDVLKVAHHGSKFSSSLEFLKRAGPAVSVIGVGKNSYGHPTEETLSRLALVGSRILRTDNDGIVKVTRNGEMLSVSQLFDF